MRTFVQVYLLTILAMKRIQNFFIIKLFESKRSEHKPYAKLNLLSFRFFETNVNLELCLSLIMHHGQKWRQEIENLLKTSNPSFIKLIMKREMSDLKGKILKLHESLFSMIFT